MTQRITLDPVTRLEGHLSVKIDVDGAHVSNAYSSGTLYRGFENILAGCDPRDAMHITQRVCGVCPVSHGMASSLALEAAWGVSIPNNARIIRNLILAANFVQSHILHFYHLNLLDYIDGPAMLPWTPHYAIEARFSAAQTATLIDHYRQALVARQQAHELGAVFGGKLPHTPVFEAGGVTAGPTSSRINTFRALLTQLTAFVEQHYLPDAELLAQTYPEYFDIGRGYGNLLAFGVFDLDAAGQAKLLRRGVVSNGATQVQPLNLSAINEQVAYAWYEGASPPSGDTPAPPPTNGGAYKVYLPVVSSSPPPPQPTVERNVPAPDKAGAYSWLKAPRYQQQPCETGPLARMWINGNYRRGISVMDRHLARAQETRLILQAMSGWLNQLQVGGACYTRPTARASAQGIGLTEAPRGALGHWVAISGGQIAHYDIITPTCWNCSPRDDQGQPGPMEHALLGTAVANGDEPIEVLRIVHSYDPCLACAVH
ncbi:MAG: periplasmic [NiFeSe] hydrogenase large subunit [Anaerolineae bacterium]